jgi:hypothetical protein
MELRNAQARFKEAIGALSVPARSRSATLPDIAEFVKSRGGQAAFDAAEGIA